MIVKITTKIDFSMYSMNDKMWWKQEIDLRSRWQEHALKVLGLTVLKPSVFSQYYEVRQNLDFVGDLSIFSYTDKVSKRMSVEEMKKQYDDFIDDIIKEWTITCEIKDKEKPWLKTIKDDTKGQTVHSKRRPAIFESCRNQYTRISNSLVTWWNRGKNKVC